MEWPGGPRWPGEVKSEIETPPGVSVVVMKDSGVRADWIPPNARVIVMNSRTAQFSDRVMGSSERLLNCDGEWNIPALPGVTPEQVCVATDEPTFYDGKWGAGWALFTGTASHAKRWSSQPRLSPPVWHCEYMKRGVRMVSLMHRLGAKQ